MHPGGGDAEARERAVGGRGGGEDPVAAAVEGRQHRGHRRRRPLVVSPQGRVRRQLGVVAARQRQPHHPRHQRGGDAGRSRRRQVHEVVAALGQRVDDRRQARDADRKAAEVHLGDRGEAAVDAGVRADQVHLEPGHAALADRLQRPGDPVRRADAVRDDRDAARLTVAVGQLALLAAEEGGGGGVGDGRQAGVEDPQPQPRVQRRSRRLAQLALVHAAGAAGEVAVGEGLALQQGDRVALQADGVQPRADERARVGGGEVRADRSASRVTLAHDPLGHAQDGGRVGRRGAVAAERADRDRQRGVGPLGGRALVAAALGPAGADVREEALPVGGRRRLGPREADVDARVVVRAAGAGAAAGVDVDGGREVELTGARAVADLPDLEQLGEPAAVARLQRRGDREERVRERRDDLVLGEVDGDVLDVAREPLQRLVVGRGDPPAQDVDGLGLAAEARRELLGDEGVLVALGEGDGAVDGVVVGEGHEVHAAALGELVDLLGRRRALRKAQRARHAELGDLGCRGVAVKIDPDGRWALVLCHHPADSPAKQAAR